MNISERVGIHTFLVYEHCGENHVLSIIIFMLIFQILNMD